jgi:flagellar motor switch/type III secretory pathway protein FliN
LEKSLIKQISLELFSLNDAPLLGEVPFDWSSFSKKIAEELDESSLDISPSSPKWEKSSAVPIPTGDHSQILSFTAAPLTGHVFWIMSKQEIAKLITFFTQPNIQEMGFSSDILLEGYYHYLVTQTLFYLSSHPLFQGLSLQIDDENALPDTVLIRDFTISVQGKNVQGKLAMSAPFHKAWIDHIKKFPPSPSLWQENVTIPLAVTIGYVNLSSELLSSLEKGSYILLDHLSFDPTDQKGEAHLFCKNIHLFSLTIDKDKSTIMPKKIQEAPMSEEESVSLGELPITIHVELTSIHYPLKKLLALEPGGVIDLPPIGDKVSLVANGKKIATGELVQTDDKFAVRIDEITSS